MKSRPIPLIAGLVAAAMLLMAEVSSARPCVYHGVDDTARVIDRTGAIFKPYPNPIQAAQCDRLRVVNGAVRVLPADTSAEQTPSKLVTQGALVEPASTGSAASNSKPTVFSILGAVLEGHERMVSGSSRGADSDYLREAIPTGLLHVPSADLKIPLASAVDPQLKWVEISSGGKSVFRQSIPAGEILLPAAILKRYPVVQWRVSYGSETLTGELRVVDDSTWLAAKLAAEEKVLAEADPLMRKLRTAVLLCEAGFVWDARKLVESALEL